MFGPARSVDLLGRPGYLECMMLDLYDTRCKVWSLVGQSDVSPREFSGLLSRFHTLDNILSANCELLIEELELDEERAVDISTACDGLSRAADFFEAVNSRKIKTVTMFDENYPERFHELNDPPPLIFYRGKLPSKEERIVTIVGTSAPSAEGIAVAVDFGAQMASRGVSLLSGLARGIDAAALVGATGSSGAPGSSGATEATEATEAAGAAGTIVPGDKNGKPGPQGRRNAAPVYAAATSGLEYIYPDENSSLARQVSERGAVFSEYSPDQDFELEHVGPANRLCVALSQAVVIGEIFSDSDGARDVAEFCVDVGKLLFVLVPTEQPIADEKALENLLAMGAIGVRYPDEIDSIVKCLV